MDILLTGTVYESRGSWYEVRLESGGYVKARVRGYLKLAGSRLRKSNPVAVGDRVNVSHKRGDYIIQDVLEGKNTFCRRIDCGDREHIMAANIDLLCIVASLCSPYVPRMFIDTLTISAAMFHIPVIIVFNKTDLYLKKDIAKCHKWQNAYTEIGYRSMSLSYKDKLTYQSLEKRLVNQRTLLVGYSGSGKSTLVNRLIPSACVATSAVNSATGTGRHTTTFSKMYVLSEKKMELIDTPGVRVFGLPCIPAGMLRLYMQDFLPYHAYCSFSNCTHTHEADCAILSGIATGKVDQERYNTYLELYHYLKSTRTDNSSGP